MAGVLDLMNYVQKQGEAGRERGTESRLNSLAQQAYSASQDQRAGLLSEMAKLDRNSAAAANKQFSADDERQEKMLFNTARMLKAAPPEYKEALFQNMRPQIENYLPGLPLNYNGQVEQGVDAFIASRSGGLGSNVQSTYVNAQGQRVAIMRDGSQQVLGDANQSIRVMEQEGANPYGVVTSGGVAGQVVQLGQQQGQPAPSAPGEVPFSIDPSLPPQVQASIRANEPQWAQGGQVQIGQPSGPVRTPTAGEKAAAEAQAKADVELRNASRMTQIETDRERQTRLAQAQAEAEASRLYGSNDSRKMARDAVAKLPQLQNVARGLDRIEGALGNLSGSFVDTGPVDQFYTRFTREGQELEAATSSIQESLLALTRVPGVGSQSDLEAKIAALKFPQLGMDPAVNQNTMRALRAFVSDLQNSIAQRAGQPEPAGAPRTVKRTGTVNGRKVVQYSDGSVEYAD